MSSNLAFFLTKNQTRALQLLTLDPGTVDPKWSVTLTQLQQRRMVEGDGENHWSLTKAGRLAADLMVELNGHGA
jgi:hypothetical protein